MEVYQDLKTCLSQEVGWHDQTVDVRASDDEAEQEVEVLVGQANIDVLDSL